MSLQEVDYIFDSNEYLCESYNRDKGMSVIKIPFKEVGVFADIGTILGLCNLDNKYYYLLSLPEGISSMIVDSFYEESIAKQDELMSINEAIYNGLGFDYKTLNLYIY